MVAGKVLLFHTECFNTQSGEVITFLKLHISHSCIYTISGGQRYINVTKYTVITNCMENKHIVVRNSIFSQDATSSFSVYYVRTRCGFSVLSLVNLLSTN